jgi:hypothetical protein
VKRIVGWWLLAVVLTAGARLAGVPAWGGQDWALTVTILILACVHCWADEADAILREAREDD